MLLRDVMIFDISSILNLVFPVTVLMLQMVFAKVTR